MPPINWPFMFGPAEQKANEGLQAKVLQTLTTGLRVYRFASTAEMPETWYSGSWWIGVSPFQAIQRYAGENMLSLGWAARLCLAVDQEWNRMDVLVTAQLAQPVAVWMGTPKTQRPKETKPAVPALVDLQGNQLTRGYPKGYGAHYRAHWEPDRAVTQYYVPGLGQTVPPGNGKILWQQVFAGTPRHLMIPSHAS